MWLIVKIGDMRERERERHFVEEEERKKGEDFYIVYSV